MEEITNSVNNSTHAAKKQTFQQNSNWIGMKFGRIDLQVNTHR